MKVWIFTAWSAHSGRDVIAVTNKKPTEKQQWSLLREYLCALNARTEFFHPIDEYAATGFEVTHERVRSMSAKPGRLQATRK